MNNSPVITTGDGSHSILDAATQVTYHSMHGAIQEGQHVFIRNGLDFVAQRLRQISILEVGFGTGLNALLSYLYTKAHPDLTLQYTGIEKFPLSGEIVAQLNYCSQLHAEQTRPVFDQMHADKTFSVDQFRFSLLTRDILDFKTTESYDLVYFDAFAPSDQPEMWQPQIFQSLKDCMRPHGILVTYCAQGQFKRTLKTLGFQVEALPGPPGKWEMVRGMKTVYGVTV